MTKKGKGHVITIPNFDKDLHIRAKAAAAIAETTLRDWIKQAIREKLDREKN